MPKSRFLGIYFQIRKQSSVKHLISFLAKSQDEFKVIHQNPLHLCLLHNNTVNRGLVRGDLKVCSSITTRLTNIRLYEGISYSFAFIYFPGHSYKLERQNFLCFYLLYLTYKLKSHLSFQGNNVKLIEQKLQYWYNVGPFVLLFKHQYKLKSEFKTIIHSVMTSKTMVI